jgi:flagellin
MSFRINTNVNAMNAMRNLSMTNVEFAKSISRLSTGLRINSAADDPAGLMISERFRSQIGGIDQAIRNSQDAINYAKTAEGALDEVNRLLRDARTLAVAAGNTGTLSGAELQANQAQLQGITESITRIAQNTQFGTKRLLDGSSGVTASVTNATTVAGLSVGGNFAGTTLTANAGVEMQVTTAATQAAMNSKTLATSATAVGAGSFTINGRTFTTDAATTAAQVVDMVNSSTGQTGVTARYDSGGGGRIVLETTAYGTGARIDLADANGVFLSAAGANSTVGVNAVANVRIGGGSGPVAVFTGGQNGNSGLVLTDTAGNMLRLTSAGNAVAGSYSTVGQVRVGSASFQIGANSGQTTSLSLGNFAASELGTGVVAATNLSNVDITTASGASNALQVIDKAIDDITRARGQVGSFQRNVLESNIRSLGVARENLAATESTIRDTDIAAEMTNYTKLQILQQAGMSVLAQANAGPQTVLALLR